MPVKLRKAKRHTSVAAEVERWSMLFETSFDYFDALGFGHANEASARDAAPEAWQRLGAQFLANRSENAAREIPWALEQFGSPPCP